MPDRVISSLGRENEGFLTHFAHTAALTRSSCSRYFVDHQDRGDALHAKRKCAVDSFHEFPPPSSPSGEITSSFLETYGLVYFSPINRFVEIEVTIDNLEKWCSFIQEHFIVARNIFSLLPNLLYVVRILTFRRAR